jgi:hypothetical protein
MRIEKCILVQRDQRGRGENKAGGKGPKEKRVPFALSGCEVVRTILAAALGRIAVPIVDELS